MNYKEKLFSQTIRLLKVYFNLSKNNLWLLKFRNMEDLSYLQEKRILRNDFVALNLETDQIADVAAEMRR